MFSFLKKDIGKRFKKEASEWLSFYPEIKHKWNDGQLAISHPKKLNEQILFQFNSKKLTIKHQNKSKTFSDGIASKVPIHEILGFMTNEILTEKDTEIIKPSLIENEVALLMTNEYGQVLTYDLNKFNGLGNVYRKFENIELAKEYLKKLKPEKELSLEASIFDKNYNILEQQRITNANNV